MPSTFGGFRPSRGGPGYSVDWHGAEVMAKMVVASQMAIDEYSAMAAALAREHGPDRLWENETGQTQDAVYWKKAVFETRYGTEGPHVWGEWGVEDRPRFRADGSMEDVTTSDVAMFLEFGTVNQDPRPWLYPTHNALRGLLPGMVRAQYAALASIPDPFNRFRARDAAGRFASIFS